MSQPFSSPFFTQTNKRLYFPLVYDESQLVSAENIPLTEDRSAWGVAGHVIFAREEVIWSTPEERDLICVEKGITPIDEGKPAGSAFFLPLRIGEEMLGLISAQSYISNIFSPVFKNAMRALSSQLSTALKNDYLFAEVEQKVEDIKRQAVSLAALQELALTINSSLEPHNIWTNTCKAAAEFFHADHSGLVLFENDYQQGKVAAEYPNLGTCELKIPLRGIPDEEELIESQQHLMIFDVRSEDILGVVRDILLNLNIQSILIVPVIGKTRLLGSFSLDVIQKQRRFSDEEIELCKTFASQVAVAIENAQLFEAEAQRRKEAETLREAATALTNTLDQYEIFARILNELKKVVPYDSASIQLLKGDCLEIIGGNGFPNLPKLLGEFFPIDGDNPNHEVVLLKKPYIVPDAPAVYKAFTEELHKPARIRSWLGVPMLVGDQLVGMIALDKREFFSTPKNMGG